mgnify:FL=1|jgi:hypothetical protein
MKKNKKVPDDDRMDSMIYKKDKKGETLDLYKGPSGIQNNDDSFGSNKTPMGETITSDPGNMA